MSKEYPHWVCSNCGLAANTLTCLVKYGSLPIKVAFDVSTFHEGTCEVCNRSVSVTESRDFFYPDFTLLSAKFKRNL